MTVDRSGYSRRPYWATLASSAPLNPLRTQFCVQWQKLLQIQKSDNSQNSELCIRWVFSNSNVSWSYELMSSVSFLWCQSAGIPFLMTTDSFLLFPRSRSTVSILFSRNPPFTVKLWRIVIILEYWLLYLFITIVQRFSQSLTHVPPACFL